MKKIFVATDFSPIADQAFLYAAHIAAQWEATLILGHVMSPSPFLAHSPGDMIDQSLHDMQMQAEVHLQSMSAQLPASIREHLELTYEVREGLVIDQLLDMVKTTEADLVVMGTHGNSGWRDVLMGTHSAALVGQVKVPLLLIPPKVLFRPPTHLVYAIDYRDVPDRELGQLREWVGAFGATLTLLHIDVEEGEVEEDQLFSLRNTVAAFEGMKSVEYAFVEDRDPLIAINDWIDEHKADLLVVKHRNQNFFQQLVHKSLSRQLTQYTSVPLLVIRQ